jgi:cytochrome c-type biogenesis protein CcmF
VQYKPMIRFIWLGCLVMALGGLVAASDRRYRMATAPKESKAAAATEPA